MRLATLLGLAGIVIGLVLGYALWGFQMDDLASTLEKTRADLQKTQGWLGEEIRASDERHAEVSARLRKALADLARARAQLARVSAAATPSASPGRGQPAGAGPGELARSAR